MNLSANKNLPLQTVQLEAWRAVIALRSCLSRFLLPTM